MSGRRSHPRVAITPAAHGNLRLLHDVVVQQVEAGEVVAISREPGVKGEMLAIEMPTGPEIQHLQGRVIDSSPLIIDGHLRHRLRLNPQTGPGCAPAPPHGEHE